MNPPIDAPTRWTVAQPQAIDEPDHIVGHVADRVRRRPAPHHDVGKARRREVPQVGRFTYVPVVEPDDEKTAPGQGLAQLVRPGDHLRRQAHDQHDRLRARVTERLVRQLDAIRGEPGPACEQRHHPWAQSRMPMSPPVTSAVRQRLGSAATGFSR